MTILNLVSRALYGLSFEELSRLFFRGRPPGRRRRSPVSAVIADDDRFSWG